MVTQVGLSAGALAAATAYVGLIDPNRSAAYPQCPTRVVLDLDCPFCGGLRTVHALVHGDLSGALDHNLFVVVLLPVLVATWVVWAAGRLGWGPSWLRDARLPRPLVPVLLTLGLLFTVARNLPVPALAPLGSY